MLKKIISLILATLTVCSLTVTVFSEDLPFKDVKKKSWFYEAVSYVYKKEIMNGTSATQFEPNGEVTRAMFVTMLGRLHGAAEATETKFTDVNFKKGAWYAGYVGWASENGIVTGFDDNTFRPNESLTREQMSAIISRYIEFTGILPTKSGSAPLSFTDEKRIASWAFPSVDNMRVLGLVEGKEGGKFDPKGKLTRAQAATIIRRLDEMFELLELNDPMLPDHTVNNGAFVLLGAYDLYYAGPAFITSYNGVKVVKDTIPYLTASDDPADTQLTISQSPYRPQNEKEQFVELPDYNYFVTNTDLFYYYIDVKSSNIDIDKYPFVRFAYRTEGEASFGFYADHTGAVPIPYEEKAEKADSFKYGIAELVAGSYYEKTEKICPTLMSTADMDLLYIAAFPDKASAEAFDLTEYADVLSSYEGTAVKVEEGDASAALAEAKAKADAIVNCTDDVDPAKITGTVYYVSDSGDDSADGLSPATAWKTFKNTSKHLAGGKVHISAFSKGDALLLERGSVFNINEGEYNDLDATAGVTFGAYGEGEKPVITAELIMDEPSGKWSKTEYENVWCLDYDVFDSPGNISFKKADGTELWGIMTIPSDYVNTYGANSMYYGLVSNGEEQFISGGVMLENPGSLKNNLEYLGDKEAGKLYLYYDKGDPADAFSEIHISMTKGLLGNFTLSSEALAVVDNIAFKYTGQHAVTMGDMKGVAFRNCTFEWIGGGLQRDTTRFGNAIQNWGCCDGVFINDCYFKDIYDAAVTTQGGSGIMRNFYSSGCVLDRCDLPFEFFNHGDAAFSDSFPNPEMSNIILRDNYVTNAGFGFCDVRSDRRGAFLYTTYISGPTNYYNVIYENNVNVFVSEYALYCQEIALGKTEGTVMRNNVYYVDPTEAFYAKTIYNLIDRIGMSSTMIPYTARYLTYLNSVGVETGSTFYTVKNPDIDGKR